MAAICRYCAVYLNKLTGRENKQEEKTGKNPADEISSYDC